MKRSIIDCDGCPAVNILNSHTLTIVGENYTDAAGSSDSDVETIDLCAKCLGRYLQEFINCMSTANKIKWVENLKLGRKTK